MDHPRTLGIGIDERTAIVADEKGLRVLGEGNVIIYNAREAQVHESKEASRQAAQGVRLEVLRSGMEYAWR